MSTIDELYEKTQVTNEYGIKYTDYNINPPADLVAFYKREANINTDVSHICLNCQIGQVRKYPNTGELQVSARGTNLYSDTAMTEKIGRLRRHQKVKLLDRRSGMCLIETTVYYGICVRDTDHKAIYVESKELVAEGVCKECGSGLSAREEKKSGWVRWDDLTSFLVKCSYIPKDNDYVDSSLKVLTPEEQHQVAVLEDPILWAKEIIGVVPRIHQAISLRCSAKNKVLRWGRRAGKSYSECVEILKAAITTYVKSDSLDTLGNPVLKGATVLVVSPFLAQITLIFDQLRELISRNPDLSLVRDVKTPYHQMEFVNGGVIKGFTTGSSSGAQGGSLRGQSASIILIDEADYMPTDDILKAIKPIQITTPDVRLLVSSTPTGKREWFYSQCVESPSVKEFYFPSTVLSHWDQTREEVETEGISDSAFLQEYMATFINQVSGVYAPEYIGQAEVLYEYNQAQPFNHDGHSIDIARKQPGWIYSAGVDWNSTAGVEIVVVGMDPEQNFWVVDALNISKQQFQQHKAIEKLIDLDFKWDPNFIYVDRGYSVGTLEVMEVWSEQQKSIAPGSPGSKFGAKVHAYDFGSKVEYRHPVTKSLLKAHAKPFLVEHSVRQFEQGKIRFSYKDITLHKQLLNYIIKNISTTGQPTYGQNDDKIGDHRLDALNLALIGYLLEMSDFALNYEGPTTVHFNNSMHDRLVKLAGLEEAPASSEAGWDKLKKEWPNHLGLPGRLKGQYDPEYHKMKQVTEQLKSRYGFDKPKESNGSTIRHGFNSDTEYKETVGQPRRSGGRLKPMRRSF